jgi:hypothetical protein
MTRACAICGETRDDITDGVCTRHSCLQARVRHLAEALEAALGAMPDSIVAGPYGDGYQYAWEECTGDEQEWVAGVRRRLAGLLNAGLGPDDVRPRSRP